MNLDTFKDKKIFLLGKTRAFTHEEFLSQLRVHNISLVDKVDDTVTHIIEGRMMTPYEQNAMDELYEKGVYSFVLLELFEKLLAQEIQSNALLMSLKLSGNKERLKAFLQNEHITDTLFFQLLKLYKWQGEDFFENDDNRDITAALISRFYENIERNHNVQYATTGLFHLVEQTRNAELLETIAFLEPLVKHPKLLARLAQHPYTPKQILKRFLKTEDSYLLEAMAYNAHLDTQLINDLVIQGNHLAKIVAQHCILDEEKFTLLRPYAKDLAKNTTLDEGMQKELLSLQETAINLALAYNTQLKLPFAYQLLQSGDTAIHEALYMTQKDAIFLKEGFSNSLYHSALAKNPATPSDILEALYKKGESAILAALAANENTPVEILYQLQLDSRFARAVQTNKAFGEHIQSQNIGWLL